MCSDVAAVTSACCVPLHTAWTVLDKVQLPWQSMQGWLCADHMMQHPDRRISSENSWYALRGFLGWARCTAASDSRSIASFLAVSLFFLQAGGVST